MSELLQDDDPDPHPGTNERPINWQTNLAFDDNELADSLAEREGVFYLSDYADRVIESAQGEGELAKRKVITENAELYRLIIGNGIKQFTFIDTLEGRRRCRAWNVGGVGVSWCEDEQRYEPAKEVLERLEATFPIVDACHEQSVRNQSGSILKRLLAAVALR